MGLASTLKVHGVEKMENRLYASLYIHSKVIETFFVCVVTQLVVQRSCLFILVVS